MCELDNVPSRNAAAAVKKWCMYVYVYDLGLFLRRKFSYIERAVEIFQKRVLIKLENIFLENVSADDRVYMLTKYFFFENTYFLHVRRKLYKILFLSINSFILKLFLYM